jgi:hypothetical protein
MTDTTTTAPADPPVVDKLPGAITSQPSGSAAGEGATGVEVPEGPGAPQTSATPAEIEAEKANVASRYKIPAVQRADRTNDIMATMLKNKQMQADVQKEADDANDRLLSQPPASATAVEHMEGPASLGVPTPPPVVNRPPDQTAAEPTLPPAATTTPPPETPPTDPNAPPG